MAIDRALDTAVEDAFAEYRYQCRELEALANMGSENSKREVWQNIDRAEAALIDAITTRHRAVVLHGNGWDELAKGAAANFARWIDCPDCGDSGECESCQKAWRKIVLPLIPAIRRLLIKEAAK